MPLEVMRTIASVASFRAGSAMLSTRTSSLPCHTTAFMALALAFSDAAPGLAGPQRPPGARIEGRRLRPRPITNPREKFTESLGTARPRLPAKLDPSPARVHERYPEGEIDPPGRRRLEMEAPRHVSECSQGPRGHSERSGTREPGELGTVEHGLCCDIKGPVRVRDQ